LFSALDRTRYLSVRIPSHETARRPGKYYALKLAYNYQ
jgi:hypothetical protein